MYSKIPELRLCAHHWKADELAKVVYAGFMQRQRELQAELSKQSPLGSTGQTVGSKRKQLVAATPSKRARMAADTDPPSTAHLVDQGMVKTAPLVMVHI